MSKENKMIRFIGRVVFLFLAIPLAICLVFNMIFEAIAFLLIALYLNYSLCKKQVK